MSISREPLRIVEIDLDYCPHVWGSSPCTAVLTAATPRKCWNMYEHCGDRANFDQGSITLRFAENIHGLPKGELIYPALRSVSTSPSDVNLSGRSDRTGLLGKRARVTVELTDFADNDTGVDKYQSERVSGAAQLSGQGYEPESRGLFLARLRARAPYYLGRSLRVIDGYVGQSIIDMQTRHYVIEQWDGPDANGRVTIVAKDPLTQIDDEKAQCPRQSRGTLASDIAASGLPSITLLPAGVGDEYDATGRASLGSEIVEFSRSGDVVTLTDRALDGSSASSHSAGDLFQQCKRFEGVPILDVARELMEDFADMSSDRVQSSGWESERKWLDGINLTRTIPKPVGVNKLVGELNELGLAFFWGERTQAVGARATRPIDFGETIETFTDDAEFVQSRLEHSDLVSQRVSQVIFWHGQIDQTGSVSDGENYRRAYPVINDSGSPFRHGEDRLLQIFSPWLGTGNDGIAAAIADRLSSRFEQVPFEISFAIDAKDRARVSLGSLVRVRTTRYVGPDGEPLDQVMQVVSLHEVQSGHRSDVTVRSATFTGRYGFLMANDAPDYDAATTEDKEFGCFLIDEAIGDFGDGTEPYSIF